jgi:hypothetical protein
MIAGKYTPFQLGYNDGRNGVNNRDLSAFTEAQKASYGKGFDIATGKE